MIPLAEDLYEAAVSMNIELETTLSGLQKTTPSSINELADLVYALRECSKVVKDTHTAMTKLQSMFERMLSTVYIAMGPMAPEKITTEYATVEIEPDLGTSIPKKGTEQYVQVLNFLGIPKEVIEHGVLVIEYPGWCSFYTAMQSRGEELPENIGSHLTIYDSMKVKIRKRKAMKGALNVIQPSNSSHTDVKADVPF